VRACHFLILVVFALVSLPACAQRRIPVWIDSDPSVERGGHEVDDGFALIEAFHSPELEIRGVSIVFGNAPLVKAWPIGKEIVERFGPGGLRVYRGAAGAEDLGKPTDASEALAEALSHGPLNILAIGPVTNVGTVLKLHPELAKNVERVVAVAGRRPGQHFVVSPKQAQPFRDFNFEMDPAGFQVLLDAHVPIVLAPWEISSKVWLREDDLRKLEQGGADAQYLVPPATDWLAWWKEKIGVDGFNPFDTLAVGYVLAPLTMTCEQLNARIETGPDDTVSGATVKGKPYLLVSARANSTEQVTYCSEAGAQFKDDLLERLLNSPKEEGRKAHAQAEPDISGYDRLLRTYVTEDGWVDYPGLGRERAVVDRFLRALDKASPNDFKNKRETLAFWINAYNAFTLGDALDSVYGKHRSVRDVPGFFDGRKHAVAGQQLTLDDIERRGRDLGDPRIHFAIVCASSSCPKLRRFAYTAEKLESQLDRVAKEFLADPNRGLRFDAKTNDLYVSPILEWYRGDFVGGRDKEAGKTDRAMLAFIAKYAPADAAQHIRDHPPELHYFDYDWSLNSLDTHGPQN
jgi:pyrimidine-specific ribonucleoside hydrolase